MNLRSGSELVTDTDTGSAFGPVRLFVSLIFLVYPFAVYFLLERLGPGVLGAALVALLLIRQPEIWRKRPWLVFPALAAALVFFWLDEAASESLLRLYPVVANLILFGVFALTIARPPSLAQRFARSHGTPITWRVNHSSAARS